METEKLRKSMIDSRALLEDYRSQGQFIVEAINAFNRLYGLVIDPSKENLKEISNVVNKLNIEIDQYKKYVPSVTETVDQLNHWLEMRLKEKAYMIEKQTVEIDPIETGGFILDIGGGGEGIIGRLNGRKVIAIDKRYEELEETENESLKIVMDATDLKFLHSSFDVATSFFTLMYIENDLHPRVFNEIHRVLKEHGRFLIWDAKIPQRVEDKPFFFVPLEIKLPGEKVETGYGSILDHQDLEYFKGLAKRTGFKVVSEWEKDEIFFLELIKHLS